MLDADEVLERLKTANERVVTLRLEYKDLWDWYAEGGHRFIFDQDGVMPLPDDLLAIQHNLDEAKEEQSRLRIIWREALDQRNRM